MTAWTPRPDTVVYDRAHDRDGVLLGRAADGTWRLAGRGDERWNTGHVGPARARPVDEFGFEMPHPLRPWDLLDPGWHQDLDATGSRCPQAPADGDAAGLAAGGVPAVG